MIFLKDIDLLQNVLYNLTLCYLITCDTWFKYCKEKEFKVHKSKSEAAVLLFFFFPLKFQAFLSVKVFRLKKQWVPKYSEQHK